MIDQAPATPAPTVPEETTAADAVLFERARTSADVLTGLITAGMLTHVARPGKLPELLHPDGDPDLVRTVWDQALAVGYQAGKAVASGRWNTDRLDEARQALADAGYERMGAAVEAAAYAAPSRRRAPNPADADAWTVRDRT